MEILACLNSTHSYQVRYDARSWIILEKPLFPGQGCSGSRGRSARIQSEVPLRDSFTPLGNFESLIHVPSRGRKSEKSSWTWWEPINPRSGSTCVLNDKTYFLWLLLRLLSRSRWEIWMRTDTHLSDRGTVTFTCRQFAPFSQSLLTLISPLEEPCGLCTAFHIGDASPAFISTWRIS